MTLHIDFTDETEQVTAQQEQDVRNLLEKAAEMEGITGDAEVSITFVTDEVIHEINKQYRDKDRATDVISFAMEEMGEGELEISGADLPRILGDIIISLDTAKEQAEEYGHSLSREIGFLTLHGFLHLLGYDHMTEEDEKEMFGRQDEILQAFGLAR
ncbi:metal-binding heat shock protein [Fictibacillus macauensis ZFHKF-1]|uniref:Endoribonuclease YbeY n=1 Tax=Fictibacillus macauensis ZFHKF-1 TaxID=1196324 RepID=I8UEH1_9BACL|nr:rRNA maturation RNase YbeY [Fictibacillus macauensis]EIT85213.1 metal-binding heat shock protein [Fictibacillus macauensis ZFHKF-1]